MPSPSMSDEHKHIDEIMRQKMAGHSPTLNPGVWDAIEARTAARPNKTALWFWWLGLIVVAFGGLALLGSMTTSSALAPVRQSGSPALIAESFNAKKITPLSSKSKRDDPAEAVGIPANRNNITSTNVARSENPVLAKEEALAGRQNSEITKKGRSEEKATVPRPVSSGNVPAGSKAYQVTRPISVAPAAISVRDAVPQESNTIAPGIDETIATVQMDTTDEQPSSSSTNSGIEPVDKEDEINGTIINQEISDMQVPKQSMTDEAPQKIGLSSDSKSTTSLNTTSSSKESNEESEPVDSAKASVADTLAVLADSNGEVQQAVSAAFIPLETTPWSITILGGPNFSYRTLNSEVHHALVEQKNQHEDVIVSYSFGAMVVAPIYKTLSAKAGLYYLRLGEKYHFKNNLAEHTTVNTYRYYNADLKLNQQLLSHNRWTFHLAAGAKFNFLDKAQSSWLDPTTLEPVTHNNQTNSPFNTFTMVWSADMRLQYQLNTRWHINLTAEGDRWQHSIYKNAAGLNQRPYTFQTLLGIGINF